MNKVNIEYLKWLQTIKIGLSKHMAYKMNFLMMVIGPALVFFFVKYNLWSAIFSMKAGVIIAGYSLPDMIEYQVLVLFIALLAHSYNGMTLAEDIRLGRISSYLIYPFDFWQFHLASFFSFQFVQVIVALVTLVFFSLLGFMGHTSLSGLFYGLQICFFVSLLWFVIQYLVGLLSFWLEETWVFRVLVGLVTSFLSGAILPLEVFPGWLVTVLKYTPFPYMTFAPVKIIMGTYEGSILFASAILSFWTIVLFFIAALIWRRGIRLYTAAGM